VKKEVIDKVEELTGSAARRGFCPLIYVTPIHEDLKGRIEKEIDMFQEGKEKNLVLVHAAMSFAKNPSRSTLQTKRGWNA
jgi:hypothetical protein